MSWCAIACGKGRVSPLTSASALLGVVEIASFRAFSAREQALLDEVLPVAALSLEVLQRSLATRQLLDETQAQREQLRVTEAFFRSVLELAPDGLMVADDTGIIRLANARCETLFGYTREELIGQPVEILVPDDVRERHPALREAFHHAPSLRDMGSGRELRGLRKDGSLLPVEIGLSPLPARPGERAQVAVSIRDVTERHAQERRPLEIER